MGAKLLFIIFVHSMTAIEQSSLVIDPPVAWPFGLLKLLQGLIDIDSMGMPSSYAHTWLTLVWMPWPISTPPWLKLTEPSLAYIDMRQL